MEILVYKDTAVEVASISSTYTFSLKGTNSANHVLLVLFQDSSLTFLIVFFSHKKCYSKSQACSAQKLCIELAPLAFESICNFLFAL